MYIACKRAGGKDQYLIRESYLKDGVYLSRDLMELDDHPAHFIRYPLGRSFYIDQVIETHLRASGMKVCQEELEEMFWPYVHPEVKRRYEFARSKKSPGDPKTTPPQDFHIFDTRRLHFLRFGRMNQRGIHNVSSKIFQGVREKSRDEIEQFFMLKEKILTPTECKSYVFVIFDLHRHFSKPFAREMPQALDQGEVEKYFLDEICRLNRDKKFWSGMAMDPFLHAYLQRYAIMFFDSAYAESSYWEDLLYRELNRRRYIKVGRRKRETVLSEASKIFGVPEGELKKMSRRQITRIYRKKARECHPDRGGSHEEFVNLSRVYNELVSGHGV